jgi:predicted secreted protein
MTRHQPATAEGGAPPVTLEGAGTIATPIALLARHINENPKNVVAGSRAPTPFTVPQIF